MTGTQLEAYEFTWTADDREPVVDIALDSVPGMRAPSSLALTRGDLEAMLAAIAEAHA